MKTDVGFKNGKTLLKTQAQAEDNKQNLINNKKLIIEKQNSSCDCILFQKNKNSTVSMLINRGGEISPNHSLK
jgi:hypothetical protein